MRIWKLEAREIRSGRGGLLNAATPRRRGRAGAIRCKARRCWPCGTSASCKKWTVVLPGSYTAICEARDLRASHLPTASASAMFSIGDRTNFRAHYVLQTGQVVEVFERLRDTGMYLLPCFSIDPVSGRWVQRRGCFLVGRSSFRSGQRRLVRSHLCSNTLAALSDGVPLPRYRRAAGRQSHRWRLVQSGCRTLARLEVGQEPTWSRAG